MSESFSERELLYGILAVQTGLVSREQFVASLRNDKVGSLRNDTTVEGLGDKLLLAGALSDDSKQLLDHLVAAHLEQHDQDPAKSIAVLSSIGSLGDELKTLGMPDVNATLARLPNLQTHVPDKATSLRSEGSIQQDVNRFRILRMHAKGGIGQVSVAVDGELSREVALKELQTRYADDDNTRTRFVLEAEITGGLEHPGIVPVYGLGHYADGRPFYAMRFVRGDSLHEAIREFHSRFPDDSASDGYELELRKLLRRFIDVCDAIEYAHSRGVLHRDLKPGNVMLGRYGETLVVDWGLAKLASSTEAATAESPEPRLQPTAAEDSAPTQLGSAVGTPNYMSPEQAAGQIDKLGTASDIYSLGATLYHLLTGRPPFQGSDAASVIAAVQEGKVRAPRLTNRRVAKPLQAICLKAMATVPADRYSSARSLAEDLERWLADESISAQPDSGFQKLQRWTRRHRGVTFASAVGLFAVAAVSGLAFFVVSAERDEARHQRDRAVASETEAQENFEAAEKARSEAVAQERRAERVAYNSTLSEASRLLGSDPMMARSLLENDLRCPPRQRGFLWHCLTQQVVRETRAIALDNLKSYALCYSPDGSKLAMGSSEPGQIVIRDAPSGEQIVTLDTDLPSVQEMMFSPDGKTLAAIHSESQFNEQSMFGGMTVSVEVWDVNTAARIAARRQDMPSNFQLSADEAGFKLHSFTSEFDFSQNHQEYRWKLPIVTNELGQVIDRWYLWQTVRVDSGETFSKYLSISDDATVPYGFAVDDDWLSCTLTTSAGAFVWLYDTSRNRSVIWKALGKPESSYEPLIVNDKAATLMEIDIPEDTIATISSLAELNTIKFVFEASLYHVDFENLDSPRRTPLGRYQSDITIESRAQTIGHDESVSTLAMLVDKRPLIQLVDVNKPDKIHQIPAHLGDVTSVAMSPDGQQMASLGLDRVLRLWDVPQALAKRQFTVASVERPRRLLLTPDGTQLIALALGKEISENENTDAAAVDDGQVTPQQKIYFQSETFNLHDATSLSTVDFDNPPKFLPPRDDGSPASVFGAFADGLAKSMMGIFEMHPVSNGATQAKLSADGKFLILAGPDRLLRYRLATGKGEELWGTSSPDLQQPIGLSQIVVSDDLRLFATLTADQKTVAVYDIVNKSKQYQYSDEEASITEIQFVPHTQELFVVKEVGDPDKASISRNVCEAHDIAQQTVRVLPVPPLEVVESWTISEDGVYLIAYQFYDRKVLVFDLQTEAVLSQIYLVNEKPKGMLPGSELLMVAGEAGEVRFWDTRLNQYRAVLQVLRDEAVRQIVLSADGETMVVLGEEGSLRFFGADRLRDDLADIHAMMQVSPDLVEPPDNMQKQVKADSQGEPPTIELFDNMSDLPLPASQPNVPNGNPPPPAPDQGVPIPPRPVIDPEA